MTDTTQQEREMISVRAVAMDWLKKHYPTLCEHSGLCERIGGRLYTRTTLPQRVAETCTGCNGRGEVGGLLPAGGGYDSQECPFCKGTGKEPVAEGKAEHGQLDPRTALEQARSMLRYVESYNGQKWSPALDSPDRQNLAQALDHLMETAAMLLNMADRLTTQPSPSEREASESATKQIAGLLSSMFASAVQHVRGQDEEVTGYTVKTGALHKIVGILQGLGCTVIIPSNMTTAHETAIGLLAGISGGATDVPILSEVHADAWQPIESAPRSIQPLLIAKRDGRISIETGHYAHHMMYAAKVDGEDCSFTHWMPLPTHPRLEGGK